MTQSAVRQIVLASRPKGPPTLENFRLEALDEIRKTPIVDASRIAATGYCFGGMAALRPLTSERKTRWTSSGANVD
jgi:dienelactone hydrolase